MGKSKMMYVAVAAAVFVGSKIMLIPVAMY